MIGALFLAIPRTSLVISVYEREVVRYTPIFEFFFRLELAMVYSRHLDGVKLAHIIAIRYMGDEQYSVELSDFDLQKDIKYEELIEKAVEIYG